MVIGTALGWSNFRTIVLAIVLAFFFGYSLTMLPLLRAGLALGAAIPLALASDTISIAVMEVVDNAIILLIPGALDAGLTDALFWGSLAASLVIAGAVAFPVNRWLIARGKGHAVVHEHHHGTRARSCALHPGTRVPGVGEARDLDDVARVRRVDELAAADVDADVAEPVEEDEVARLELRRARPASPPRTARRRGAAAKRPSGRRRTRRSRSSRSRCGLAPPQTYGMPRYCIAIPTTPPYA